MHEYQIIFENYEVCNEIEMIEYTTILKCKLRRQTVHTSTPYAFTPPVQ